MVISRYTKKQFTHSQMLGAARSRADQPALPWTCCLSIDGRHLAGVDRCNKRSSRPWHQNLSRSGPACTEQGAAATISKMLVVFCCRLLHVSGATAQVLRCEHRHEQRELMQIRVNFSMLNPFEKQLISSTTSNGPLKHSPFAALDSSSSRKRCAAFVCFPTAV